MYGLPSVRGRPGSMRPGWLLGFKAALLVAGSCAALSVGLTSAWGDSGPGGGYQEVTVRPGDTIWGIAAERYPGSDLRERVDRIERINGLSDPVLQPGQHLRVPAR